MTSPADRIKGRGAATNAEGRFAVTVREAADDGWHRDDEPAPHPATREAAPRPLIGAWGFRASSCMAAADGRGVSRNTNSARVLGTHAPQARLNG